MRKKKSKPEKLSRHHRCCRTNGGTDDYPPNNVVLLPDHIHRYWHAIFGAKTPEQIASTMNKWFIQSDWEFLAKKRGMS